MKFDYDSINSLSLDELEKLHNTYGINFIAEGGRVSSIQIGEINDSETNDN